MTLPLGRSYQPRGVSLGDVYPLVTHFAFTDDPIAQIGVLLGIRQRLEGRFVGSLYTIHSAVRGSARYLLFPRNRHHTFDDYLDALLPDGDPQKGVLGQVCKIDRELSEMRELATLAQNIAGERLRTRQARLSWTAPGEVEDTMPSGYESGHAMDGPYSLEEIRREAKSLEGLKGYDNNPLIETIQNRHKYHVRPKEQRAKSKYKTRKGTRNRGQIIDI
ncbi:uncharacterized protein F4822DRAFT_430793 [Hypoxylon trugodes]|uniref:uncharacterized protein n=1 Tax=Hypoxylon trugodes TaxID=326681 RepID=UPI00219358F1|nr:uncharacterized protein F4822DRAFT_430793 [Hypoxylon trugodes]KAI1388038.1 hypothetical protein F4822DRAFT_430793 [Hypoxylon trugodes]